MLTIDRLRAMPAANRDGYLWQCRYKLDTQEHDQPRWEQHAAEARKAAKAAELFAERMAAELKIIRAYFATLEAAGLWPVAAPGGER